MSFLAPAAATTGLHLSPGCMLVALLTVLAIFYPKDAENAALALELFLRLELMNLRMYLMQRKLHRQLSKQMREGWGAEPPPFRFVRIQDREQP